MFKNLWRDLKSINWSIFLKWLFIFWTTFTFTVLIDHSPSLFVISCAVLLYIYSLEKQIDNLEEALKTKEKEWKAVDMEERLKALKRLEQQNENKK